MSEVIYNRYIITPPRKKFYLKWKEENMENREMKRHIISLENK
jgi:hypothetical protein